MIRTLVRCLLFLMIFHGLVWADIYTWTDGDHVTHYSRKKPNPKEAKKVSVIRETEDRLTVSLNEYGEYTALKYGDAPEVYDQGAALYKGESLKKKTDRINGVLGNAFGIRYTINGQSKGKRLPLRIRLTHPPMIVPETGETITFQAWQSYPQTGQPNYDGFQFEHPWEIVPGEWRIQLWHKGTMLFEKAFVVN